MAKVQKAVSFSNAVININDDTIIETTKNDVLIYRLSDILKEWNGIPGISITFKKDDQLVGIEDE